MLTGLQPWLINFWSWEEEAAAGDQPLCSVTAWVPRVPLEHLDHVDLPKDTLGLYFTHSGPGSVGSSSSLTFISSVHKKVWGSQCM